MDWIEVLLTSVSMAVDATTVNAANGLEEPDMKVSKMAFIAGVFGLMQFLMPCNQHKTTARFLQILLLAIMLQLAKNGY